MSHQSYRTVREVREEVTEYSEATEDESFQDQPVQSTQTNAFNEQPQALERSYSEQETDELEFSQRDRELEGHIGSARSSLDAAQPRLNLPPSHHRQNGSMDGRRGRGTIPGERSAPPTTPPEELDDGSRGQYEDAENEEQDSQGMLQPSTNFVPAFFGTHGTVYYKKKQPNIGARRGERSRERDPEDHSQKQQQQEYDPTQAQDLTGQPTTQNQMNPPPAGASSYDGSMGQQQPPQGLPSQANVRPTQPSSAQPLSQPSLHFGGPSAAAAPQSSNFPSLGGNNRIPGQGTPDFPSQPQQPQMHLPGQTGGRPPLSATQQQQQPQQQRQQPMQPSRVPQQQQQPPMQPSRVPQQQQPQYAQPPGAPHQQQQQRMQPPGLPPRPSAPQQQQQQMRQPSPARQSAPSPSAQYLQGGRPQASPNASPRPSPASMLPLQGASRPMQSPPSPNQASQIAPHATQSQIPHPQAPNAAMPGNAPPNRPPPPGASSQQPPQQRPQPGAPQLPPRQGQPPQAPHPQAPVAQPQHAMPQQPQQRQPPSAQHQTPQQPQQRPPPGAQQPLSQHPQQQQPPQLPQRPGSAANVPPTPPPSRDQPPTAQPPQPTAPTPKRVQFTPQDQNPFVQAAASAASSVRAPAKSAMKAPSAAPGAGQRDVNAPMSQNARQPPQGGRAQPGAPRGAQAPAQPAAPKPTPQNLLGMITRGELPADGALPKELLASPEMKKSLVELSFAAVVTTGEAWLAPEIFKQRVKESGGVDKKMEKLGQVWRTRFAGVQERKGNTVQ